MLMYFFITMLAGFAGSFHCIGMCGGFACGLGADPANSPMKTALRHILYNTGRVVTYMFIGALAGALGSELLGSSMLAAHNMVQHSGHAVSSGGQGVSGFVMAGEFGVMQRLLSVATGLLVLVMALQLMGLLRHSNKSWIFFGSNFFSSAMRSILRSPNPSAPVALGVVNGFLPCPLVYAFAAMAAATGSVAHGVLVMAALGLGTFPAMLFMGGGARLLSGRIRQSGVRLASGFLVLIGFVTIARGVAPALLHFPWHGA